MEKKRKANSFNWVLLRISVIPIFILTLVITSFGAKSFANSMNQEVKQELQDLCNTILTMYDTIYEGNYSMVEQDGAIYLLKGEHLLNGDFTIIDSIKEQTEVDITFFYQDTRVITTLVSEDNVRLIGTRASAVVIRDVLENRGTVFYPRVDVEGKKYFAYYAPILNEDGTCMGMIFVGKPSADVEKLIQNSILPIILISLAAMLITGFFTIRYSKQLTGTIQRIELFLEKVANGNLHTDFDPTILKRNDELGEMGRYIVKMQRSLRELVEQDILTGLNNRRSAEKQLKQVQSNSIKSGLPFCVAIGDIDHFKYVNDTFGHECGDFVLMDISARLRRHMKGKGFAARWGGEEFLLVFEDMSYERAVENLELLAEDIRGMGVDYKDETAINVTMTFGIAPGGEDNLDNIIRNADKKLYYGKNNGRNQIVQ